MLTGLEACSYVRSDALWGGPALLRKTEGNVRGTLSEFALRRRIELHQGRIDVGGLEKLQDFEIEIGKRVLGHGIITRLGWSSILAKTA